MDGDSRHSQFGGITVILVTLFLSFIAIAVFYILYRQFHGGWESLGVIDPWRNVLAHTLYQNKKPILWDVYIEGEKLEWEWGEFKVSEGFRMTFGCHLAPNFLLSHFAPK